MNEKCLKCKKQKNWRKSPSDAIGWDLERNLCAMTSARGGLWPFEPEVDVFIWQTEVRLRS